MAIETSPESPAPLRVINAKLAEWVARLGTVWVEGQVTQINARRGMAQAFIELRDVDQNISARLVAAPEVVAGVGSDLIEGDRIVAHVKAEYWAKRGQLVLRAAEIRKVGIGDLLARVERLKTQLHQEGLFSPGRKRTLPFLPRTIGLICGRDSAAERDVVQNVQRRWPNVTFEIRQVAVQGIEAASDVRGALTDLDAMEGVDVIVIARGGGSVEDLLPFSDETLVRAVARTRTPVVSAIGHEQDTPLLDFVADVRASTPTDAARLIVPSVDEQLDLVHALSERSRRRIAALIDTQSHLLARFQQHPLLTSPTAVVDEAERAIRDLSRRSSTSLLHQLQLASTTTEHQTTALRAYSPRATLARGYSIVKTSDGSIVSSYSQVTPNKMVKILVLDGEIDATVTATTGGTS